LKNDFLKLIIDKKLAQGSSSATLIDSHISAI